MQRLTYDCDICEMRKQDSNHWWLVRIDDKGFHLHGWDAALAKRKGTKHLCGEGCLHKAVGKFIGPSAPSLVQNLDETKAAISA